MREEVERSRRFVPVVLVVATVSTGDAGIIAT
jgi:precorrin-3B methylase